MPALTTIRMHAHNERESHFILYNIITNEAFAISPNAIVVLFIVAFLFLLSLLIVRINERKLLNYRMIIILKHIQSKEQRLKKDENYRCAKRNAISTEDKRMK